MKRISCARVSRATGATPQSESSWATSRRYALRVWTGRGARWIANASNSAALSLDAAGVSAIALIVFASGRRHEARDRHAREFGQPQQIDGPHRGMETLWVAACESEQPERRVGAQRKIGERGERLAIVEPAAGARCGLGTAVGPAQVVGIGARLGRDVLELGERGAVRGGAPEADRDLRHREILPETVRQHGQGRLEVARGEERQRRSVQLLADDVVLGAVADELAELPLEIADPVAQREDLAFGDRDRVAAVRMGHVDPGEDVGVVFEEVRVLLEVVGDGARVHPGPWSLTA